jgi:protoporphyrinogen oxidase
MTLQQAGVPFLLFEQDEKVGGRVQTDEIRWISLGPGISGFAHRLSGSTEIFGL